MSFTSISSPDVTVTLGEKDFILSPLGMKQWAEYCLWLQYKEYKEAILLGFPEKKCEEIYQICKTTPLAMDSADVSASHTNLDSLTKLLYLSIKLKDNSITEEYINQHLDIKDLQKTLDVFYVACGLISEDIKEGDVKN